MIARRIAAVTGLVLLCFLVAGGPRDVAAQAKPEGEMRYALYVMLINPYPWSAPLEEVRLRKP